MTDTLERDYSLTGPSTRAAEQQGLANAEWFLPVVDADTMRALQARSDRRAAANVTLWLALIIASGFWAWSTAWSWWSIPAFLVYGALYGGSADARWHECGHGTAFRTPLAERRRVPPRVVHALARAHRVAVVALPAPHRHDHRRTRRRDRLPAAAERRPRALFAYTHLQGGAVDVLAARAATPSDGSTPTPPTSCRRASIARSSGSRG